MIVICATNCFILFIHTYTFVTLKVTRIDFPAVSNLVSVETKTYAAVCHIDNAHLYKDIHMGNLKKYVKRSVDITIYMFFFNVLKRGWGRFQRFLLCPT